MLHCPTSEVLASSDHQQYDCIGEPRDAFAGKVCKGPVRKGQACGWRPRGSWHREIDASNRKDKVYFGGFVRLKLVGYDVFDEICCFCLAVPRVQLVIAD